MENVKHESEHKRASQVARIVATKTQENLEKGREAAAPSLIKEIQEGQGGQEAPHDGGTIIPEDA
jgi:hypothetical protein